MPKQTLNEMLTYLQNTIYLSDCYTASELRGVLQDVFGVSESIAAIVVDRYFAWVPVRDCHDGFFPDTSY